MKNIHLVILDLFLPPDIAVSACADLHLPAMEKLLARGAFITSPTVPISLENLLCELFNSNMQEEISIAGISAKFDQLEEGNWLRADPVHLSLQRDKMLLATVPLNTDEAKILCASLNEYFSEQNITFFAPHPQRWYIQLDAQPHIQTTPLSEVIGCNVRGALPSGENSAYWHGIFNEIQIFLFAHPLNAEREARGELPINSVWLWGEGANSTLQTKYDLVSSDDTLPEMFTYAANTHFAKWEPQWRNTEERQLLVWTGLRTALQQGDFIAWREALQSFETHYAQPFWKALRNGEITQLKIDILNVNQIRRISLKRADTWKFWRRAKSLSTYSMV